MRQLPSVQPRAQSVSFVGSFPACSPNSCPHSVLNLCPSRPIKHATISCCKQVLGQIYLCISHHFGDAFWIILDNFFSSNVSLTFFIYVYSVVKSVEISFSMITFLKSGSFDYNFSKSSQLSFILSFLLHTFEVRAFTSVNMT